LSFSIELASKIEDEITPLAADLGYGIVRVAVSKHEKNTTIQVMIERLDGNPVTIDDCEAAGRALSVRIDVMDPVDNRYSLEVSSPGIDRPLTKPQDFARFCGEHVIIKTREARDGKKLFKGILKEASESGIKLDIISQIPNCGDSIEIEYKDIWSACINGSKV
jgi:ribosome maturation factor RimP